MNNSPPRIRLSPRRRDAVLPAAACEPVGKGFLGLLMLDTQFPRPPGDAGHPDAFGVPVRRRVVSGAVPLSVVTSAEALLASGLATTFVDSALSLQAEGARAITTSCGFLVLLQDVLQAALAVPVVTSSLLHLPSALQHDARVGVLTISTEHLGEAHLRAAGVPDQRLRDVIVQGMDRAGAFAGAILGNRAEMDLDRAAAEVVDTAVEVQRRHPDVRTLVLECTNMLPYAPAIRACTGLEVVGLVQVVQRAAGQLFPNSASSSRV